MLVDAMKKLDIQKVNENKAQIQVIDLKQEVEMHNKTIMNLQENVKANHILILNLESTINVSKKSCRKLFHYNDYKIIISCKFTYYIYIFHFCGIV